MEIQPLGLYFPGATPHLTIQSAVNAAATPPRGGVWIPASYAGTDSYTNPSNVPIFDLRGSGSITLSAPSTAPTTARPIISGATALASGNFALVGWGTGASLTAIHGSDAAHYFTIVAGTTPSPYPTVQLTYANGAWAVAPVVDASVIGGTGDFTDLTVVGNTTSYTLTYNGLPVNTLSYVVRVTAIQPVS